MNQLKILGIAIALFGIFVFALIAGKILLPHRELVLTEIYNLDSKTKEQSFIGHNRPFFLSGTALLWCNGSLQKFDSLGTVITTRAKLDNLEGEVTQCQ